MASYSGWTALILMIASFYLAARIPFLNRLFGELKHQLQWHHWLGLGSIAAILWHIGQLIWDFRGAYSLLWHDMSVISGWISFLVLPIVIFFAFFRNSITYRRWRMIHLASCVSLIAALLHTYLIYEPRMTREWAVMITALLFGLAGLFFAALLHRFNFWGKSYAIYLHKEVRPGFFVTTLQSTNRENRIRCEPGQFIYIRFKGQQFTRIWHPLTIISSSSQGDLELLIKARGQDTNQLFHLTLPVPVSVMGPFGAYFWKNNDNQLWISYGVGVAIFLAAIRSFPDRFQKKVHFICCDGSDEKIFFRDELELCAYQRANFTWELFIGSGQDFVESFDSRQFQPNEFTLARICGHPGFQKSLKEKLVSKGVPRRQIHLEGL